MKRGLSFKNAALVSAGVLASAVAYYTYQLFSFVNPAKKESVY